MTAKIIVFANEKGGTGKSTLAMHTIIALLRAGKTVASFDLDPNQQSLTRYIENRKTFMTEKGVSLPLPEHTCWTEDVAKIYTLRSRLGKLANEVDAIVIDTPGSHTDLGVEAMTLADVLVTPMNDSLVDLDILALVDGETLKITGPSHFAQTVWSTRQQRMLERKPSLNWLVIRNRMLFNKSRNSQNMSILLNALSRRIHFELVGVVSERVVFRELFLKGLTMLDFKDDKIRIANTISSNTARQELFNLVEKIWGTPLLSSENPAIQQ